MLLISREPCGCQLCQRTEQISGSFVVRIMFQWDQGCFRWRVVQCCENSRTCCASSRWAPAEDAEPKRYGRAAYCRSPRKSCDDGIAAGLSRRALRPAFFKLFTNDVPVPWIISGVCICRLKQGCQGFCVEPDIPHSIPNQTLEHLLSVGKGCLPDAQAVRLCFRLAHRESPVTIWMVTGLSRRALDIQSCQIVPGCCTAQAQLNGMIIGIVKALPFHKPLPFEDRIIRIPIIIPN